MSLIVETRPEPTTLQKHLATLRRCGYRKDRATYLINVAAAEGEQAANALHLAYVDSWTEDQARAADVAAAMPMRMRA